MYDPGDVSKKGAIFGLPYTVEEADLVLLPVPLDVTVSYNDGTARAPARILRESSQLDLALPMVHNPWELKMAMTQPHVIFAENEKFRCMAKKIIENLENSAGPSGMGDRRRINDYCTEVCRVIEEESDSWIRKGKLIGIVGGDHSSPLGLIRALAGKYNFGILQIDAHMDLRKAYEGFVCSHASIMYNALQTDAVSMLVQVGIRDYCEEEEQAMRQTHKPIHTYFDEVLFERKIGGTPWRKLATEIIEDLPEHVYVSLDMDGLDPSLCPHTGTPVPGGLDFNEVNYLLNQMVRSGRKIIGFDVCESGDGSWDANVSARALFRLACLMGISNGLLDFKTKT